MTDKSSIRKLVFARRKEVTDEQVHERSLQILEKVVATEKYKNCKRILPYIDCKHEVETRDLILRALADGKEVAVPRVRGKDMDFYLLKSFDQLEPGYYGIPEPVRGEIVDWHEGLMIMPGVGFDSERNRAGYGAGFYDRWLEKHPNIETIALAFDFQIVDEVPSEPTDIKPEMVITESFFFRS